MTPEMKAKLEQLIDAWRHQAQAAMLASNTLYRTGAYEDASYERGKAFSRQSCAKKLEEVLASLEAPPPQEPFISCECPAGHGEPCPLTIEECGRRGGMRGRG